MIPQLKLGTLFIVTGRAAVGGSARRWRGVAHGTAGSNPGGRSAISEGCPDTPGGDNQRGAAAGNRALAQADASMARRSAHSNGIAVRPYWPLSHLSGVIFKRADLETAVWWVPRPRRWLFPSTSKPAELLPF